MGGLSKASALTVGRRAWEGFRVNKVVLQEDLLLGPATPPPKLLQSGFYFGGIYSGATKGTYMGGSLARTSISEANLDPPRKGVQWLVGSVCRGHLLLLVLTP